MKLRTSVIGSVLVLVLAVSGFAVAGGDGEEAADDPADSSTEQEPFVGLALADAASLAEDEDRPWRLGRQDATEFVLTADLVPGRVTFEVDDGLVTHATIESPNTDPSDTSQVEDPARAELIAAGLLRLLTVDNSFGGTDVFDDIRVARTLGSGEGALAPLDLEMVAGTLSELGMVLFIDNADIEIAALFETSPTGVAVVSVERIELLDDHAELELSLWCGSLCGVFLTYEAIPVDGGWEITGTTGPIAVS